MSLSWCIEFLEITDRRQVKLRWLHHHKSPAHKYDDSESASLVTYRKNMIQVPMLPKDPWSISLLTDACCWHNLGEEPWEICYYLIFFFLFWDRVSLCSPGYPGTYSVDQAGLKLRNPPLSASRVLGLKACTTPALLTNLFFNLIIVTNFLSSNILSTSPLFWAPLILPEESVLIGRE